MASDPVRTPLIDQAIIPAAGHGTRLRPLTLAIPKEMLPLGRKPVLEHIVDELRAAGCRRLLFVVSPAKTMVGDYFGDGARWGVRCDYVIQPEMRGLGDAILRAEEWAQGRPSAVAFGDCVVESESRPSPVARVIAAHAECGAAATVLAERVARERTGRYGILDPGGLPPADPSAPFRLQGIVEKPRPEQAPSALAVAARWVLGPVAFGVLRQTPPDASGEVGLTDAIRRMLSEGAPVWAVPLAAGERRLDIGGWDTYLVEAARAAARDPETGARVRAAVCEETPCP